MKKQQIGAWLVTLLSCIAAYILPDSNTFREQIGESGPIIHGIASLLLGMCILGSLLWFAYATYKRGMNPLGAFFGGLFLGFANILLYWMPYKKLCPHCGERVAETSKLCKFCQHTIAEVA